MEERTPGTRSVGSQGVVDGLEEGPETRLVTGEEEAG